MNKLYTILAVGALALGATFATAQAGAAAGNKQGEQRGQGQRGGQDQQQDRAQMRARMEKVNQQIFAKLGLTRQQQTQIEALDKRTQKEIADLRKAASEAGDRRAAMEKVRAVQSKRTEGLKRILTPAQFKKMEQLRKEATEQLRKEQGGQRPPPTRGQGGGSL
jgi:Spy/CpxP family protein refolding chaperone